MSEHSPTAAFINASFAAAERLNRGCACRTTDHAALAAALADGGLDADAVLAERPHLFSDTVVFVGADCLQAMSDLVAAVESVVALPAYQDYTIRTQASEGEVLASGAKTAVAEFYNNTGRLPTNNTSAGLSLATSITGKYVSQVKVETNGRVTATFSDQNGRQANAKLVASGKNTVVLSPITRAGSVEWSCKRSTIENKYLPQNCRR